MTETRRNRPETHGDARLTMTVLTTIGLVASYRAARQHPVHAAALGAIVLATFVALLWLRARAKDALARRADPPRSGIVLGTTKGPWLFSKKRPYTLGWNSLRQHVLITGPTGRGKSYSFITPILQASLRRPRTGVLYLDGKGDPLPHDVNFDYLFSPDAPNDSSCWNPLAGPDPIAAARSFADAIFPTASQPDAVFYEVRGAFAVRAVAPAIAYTGYALEAKPASTEQEVRDRLITAGLSERKATYALERKGIGVCEDQLRWLPTRDRQDADALLEYITSNNRPSPKIDETLLMPKPGAATVAALSHVLFTDGALDKLAERLDGHLDKNAPELARKRFAQLAAQVRSLAAMPQKERAGILANLENRLSIFLTPPFDRICASSDFHLADTTNGTSIGLLLPTGSYPGIAEPLGRTAVAQFQHAVLASTPETTKVAVLDEFHNFASPAFTKFLSQARSRGGAAVMSTQTIGDFHPDYRDRLLANASTQILTPGALPFDADHWSAAFGTELTPQHATSVQRRTLHDPTPITTVRTDHRELPRFTPTQLSELQPGQAIVRQVSGRTQYPAVVVNVERHA